MDKFYFVGYLGKRVEQLHLRDIIDSDDVILVSENLDEPNLYKYRLYDLFYRCHDWKYISSGEPKLKSLWNKFYNLYNFQYNEEDSHYVIFWDSAFSVYYSECFFESFKKKYPNVKLVFYIYDQMNRKYSPRILRMLKYSDAVFCTIRSDCEKYGFDYFPLVYSKPVENTNLCFKESDIYFWGNNGDRDELLHELYSYFNQNGLNCDFGIVGVSEEKMIHKSKIQYNHIISEEENVARMSKANCVLEIMHEGMNAVTARYCEVVALNKKLLTNNKSIFEEEYYNPQFIQYFDKIENIDIEWIRKKDDVEYGYNGNYSPRALIDKIKDKFK